MPMKLEDWNYKDRNAAGWLNMWDLTLQTVWGRTPWERAAPRNAPSRGVRPQHDLGTVERRGGPLLPLEAYDLYVPGEHPRATAPRLQARWSEITPRGTGPFELYDLLRRGSPRMAVYHPELRVTPEIGKLFAQESGDFPSPAAEGARNYASMVLFENGKPAKPVASSVDADKTSSGLLRYTTVAPTHRGRGLATALWVLTHECGIPAWRVSDEWFEMESQHNRINLGMMRPLLKAHALCIMRANARGVEVPTDAMASALNWESFSEELMAKAEAESKSAAAVSWPGWQPPTAEQKEAAAARKARRKKAATPIRQQRDRARPGRLVSVDAARAVTETLQDATADARELLEESDLLIQAREVVDELKDATSAVEVATAEAREVLQTVRDTSDELLAKTQEAMAAEVEKLHTAGIDARQVTDELAALLETLPAEAADMFAAMRDAAEHPSEVKDE